MHYKDGTPAKLGDIVLHDSGSVGIVIGGTVGSDYCSTQVVSFKPQSAPDYSGISKGFIGCLRNADNSIAAHAAVKVTAEPALQTREMVKIGHVDIGHG